MKANTQRFREWVNARHGLALDGYDALWRWSVADVGVFWQAVWDYFELQSPTPASAPLSSDTMPGARWFAGAQINYSTQVFRHNAAADAAGVPAIVFRNERLQRENRSLEIGWNELAAQVSALAGALQAMGVQRGDRVAAYLPNIPQAVVGLLACASLGAIWSLCATDMGVATVRDRFRQIEPKVLIGCDGTVYGGKAADRQGLLEDLLAELPTVQHLVLVPYLAQAGAAVPAAPSSGWAGHRHVWDECLRHAPLPHTEPVPFEHPLWIVYSSGTTGMPKPIVHGHGGVVLEMLKLHHLHLNLGPSAGTGDRFHWYSSSGWVMWNLQVSALLLGTTVCLYDGHPSLPEPDTLWRFASDTGATFVGAGAAYYTACMKNGLQPGNLPGIRALRGLGSTGSPLPAEAYRWGQDVVRDDLWWAVISGGTDLASAFLAGTPELPTVPGEMQARALGADIQAWDEDGRPVTDDVGEMVCVQAMPSMPLMFWGDAGHRRYTDSYFDLYPGVWRHGDWLRITPSGGAVVYGRSDATLNRHGHRMGTSELYRAVEALPEVLDSLVVDIEYLGQPSYMPLFVTLREGVKLDEALLGRIRQAIREGLSPRFVPDAILQVAEIPRTLTGKKQELPIKKLLLGRRLAEVVNKDACANPAAFDWFERFAAARQATRHKEAS
jgi:acetoacetyl-CoA synthetase